MFLIFMVMIHYANLKKHSWLCCLLQAYLQFKDRITWTTFIKLIEDNGLPNEKLSRVKLAFTYSDEKLNQNVKVMANYVASGVQWYTSYGMMHYRGNVGKNKIAKGKKTPQSSSESDASEAEKDKGNPYTNYEASDRTLRVHTNKGKHNDTKQEQFSAKKMKVGHDLRDETFFMDDVKKKKIRDDLTGETFFMDDVKLETPSAQNKGKRFNQPSSGDVNELSSDTKEDEVQEIEAGSVKKNSASKNKETSESSQIFHGHTPQRLASPMKPNEKQTPMQPMGGSEIPPPWFGAFLKNYTENIKDTMKESMKESVVDSVRDLVKDEVEKARLKPEQNKKDEAKK
jgi:hypothetical protein